MEGDRSICACPYLKLMAQSPPTGFWILQNKIETPYHSPCLLTQSGPHIGLAIPQVHQIVSHLRAFALAVASCSVCCFPHTCMTHPLPSCKVSAQVSALQRPSWTTRYKTCPTPSVSICLPLPCFLHSTYSLIGPHICFLCWFICLCFYWNAKSIRARILSALLSTVLPALRTVADT